MTHPVKGRGPPGKFAFLKPSSGKSFPEAYSVSQSCPRGRLQFPILTGESLPRPRDRLQVPILIGECSAGLPSEVRRASELRRASLRGPPGFRGPPPSEVDLGWAQPPEGEPHCQNHEHYAINVGSGCQPGPPPHPDERPPAHTNLYTPDRPLALSESALSFVFWHRDGF